MEQIIITFGTDGTAKVEVKGVKGRSCIDATKELEKALGTTTGDRKTGEYYEKPQDISNLNRS